MLNVRGDLKGVVEEMYLMFVSSYWRITLFLCDNSVFHTSLMAPSCKKRACSHFIAFGGCRWSTKQWVYQDTFKCLEKGLLVKNKNSIL